MKSPALRRSFRGDTMNPLLSSEIAQRIIELGPNERHVLGLLLRQLGHHARGQAQRSWKSNKGWMAVYWKTCGVYAGHMARLIDPPKPRNR